MFLSSCLGSPFAWLGGGERKVFFPLFHERSGKGRKSHSSTTQAPLPLFFSVLWTGKGVAGARGERRGRGGQSQFSGLLPSPEGGVGSAVGSVFKSGET